MTNSDLAALVRSRLAAKTANKKAPTPQTKTVDRVAELRAIGLTEKQIKAALAADDTETVDTTKVTFDEFKGNRMITLQFNDGRPFSFGRAKARMIVAAYDHIKRFAESDNVIRIND